MSQATPETNAVCGLFNETVSKKDLVLAHFARRLEGERDVARHDVNLLRQELEAEREKAIDWFIEYLELKHAVAVTLEENLHLADGDDCTLKILKDAYGKAKELQTKIK